MYYPLVIVVSKISAIRKPIVLSPMMSWWDFLQPDTDISL